MGNCSHFIKMRVLADASRDPGLAGLFTSLGKAGPGGGDVYRRLAAQVRCSYGTPVGFTRFFALLLLLC